MIRKLCRKRGFLVGGAAAALLLAATAIAAESNTNENAVVPGYGKIHAVPEARERPDKGLRYRVVFNVTEAADSPDKVNPGLDKVARFLNLLSQDGVRPQPGDVVAVVHGPATPAVMSDGEYRAKTGAANANLELIRRLEDAGAEVRVCGQALASRNIAHEAVDKRVQVDVAALVTLANLQLRGYALLTN